MGFDVTTATSVTDKKDAVNTTSFDINSAKEVPQLQEHTGPETPATKYDQTGEPINLPQAPSPISMFVRGLRKYMDPIADIQQMAYESQHADEYPTQVKGETSQAYQKRIDSFNQPFENQEIAKGAIGQLAPEMTVAVGIGLAHDPIATIKAVAAFTALDKVRTTVQNMLIPKPSPTLKDVLDIASFAGEAKLSGPVVDGIGDFLHNSLLSQRKSPTVDLTPDHINAITESENLTPKEKQDTLDTLGITPDHINASLSSDLPIRVPISKVIEVAGDLSKKGVETTPVSKEDLWNKYTAAEKEPTDEGFQAYINKEVENGNITKEGEGFTSTSNKFKALQEKLADVENTQLETKREVAALTEEEYNKEQTGLEPNKKVEERIQSTTQKEQRDLFKKLPIAKVRALLKDKKIQLPKGLTSEGLIAGSEDYLRQHPEDVDMLNEVLNSQHLRVSELGQGLSMSRMISPELRMYSREMRELNDVLEEKQSKEKPAEKEKRVKKEEAVKKKLKDLTDAEKEEMKKVKEEADLGKLDKFLKESVC